MQSVSQIRHQYGIKLDAPYANMIPNVIRMDTACYHYKKKQLHMIVLSEVRRDIELWYKRFEASMLVQAYHQGYLD